MSSDLLHEALRRATLSSKLKDRDEVGSNSARSPPLGSSHSATSSEGGRGNDSDDDDDDNAYTPVHTRPGTPIGTPRRRQFDATAAATLPSTSSTPGGSRSTSPTRLAKKRMAEEAERKASRDPLRRFENEISSRIFRELDVASLARCMRVSKRWRRSATINWAWYIRFQERRDEDVSTREPIWTRKESKEDWSRRFRSAFTLNGLQYQTAFEQEYEKARSDGYRTPKEEREDRWAAEASSVSNVSNLNSFGGDKGAAREYYKSLGGRTKTKSKGGSGVTGVRDRTAFGDDDFY